MTIVKYYDATRADELLADVVRLLREARPSVRAVNWFADDVGTPELKDVRSRYFAELLADDAHADYRRVLQVDINGIPSELHVQSLHGKYDHLYLAHFADMIQKYEVSSSSRKVELSASRARFPTTFVILDDLAVVVELNQLDQFASADITRWRTTGALLILNPAREVVDGFNRMFEALYADSCPVTSSADPINDTARV